MYLHDYRWNMGVTSQELSVLRKALLIAAFEDAEPLDEKEGEIAENLARIVGGVYAAKRAEREQRRDNDENGEEHQHFVPRQNDRIADRQQAPAR